MSLRHGGSALAILSTLTAASLLVGYASAQSKRKAQSNAATTSHLSWHFEPASDRAGRDFQTPLENCRSVEFLAKVWMPRPDGKGGFSLVPRWTFRVRAMKPGFLRVDNLPELADPRSAERDQQDKRTLDSFTVFISDGKKQIDLSPMNKEYVRTRSVNDFKAMQSNYVLQHVPTPLLFAELPGTFKRESDARLGGVDAAVFSQTSQMAGTRPMVFKETLWVDKAKRVPVRFTETQAIGKAEAEEVHRIEFSGWRFNDEMPRALFDTTPPQGYTAFPGYGPPRTQEKYEPEKLTGPIIATIGAKSVACTAVHSTQPENDPTGNPPTLTMRLRGMPPDKLRIEAVSQPRVRPTPNGFAVQSAGNVYDLLISNSAGVFEYSTGMGRSKESPRVAHLKEIGPQFELAADTLCCIVFGDMLEEFRRTGTEHVAGHDTIVYKRRAEDPNDSEQYVMWVDAKTRLPVRISMCAPGQQC